MLTTSTSWDIFNPKRTFIVSLEFSTGRTDFWYPWNKCLRRASSFSAMEPKEAKAERKQREEEGVCACDYVTWSTAWRKEPMRKGSTDDTKYLSFLPEAWWINLEELSPWAFNTNSEGGKGGKLTPMWTGCGNQLGFDPFLLVLDFLLWVGVLLIAY